jgi:hypothetical protein
MFIALRQRQCQQETTILAERHLSALDDRKSAALQTEINLDAITKAERIMRQIDARWMDYQQKRGGGQSRNQFAGHGRASGAERVFDSGHNKRPRLPRPVRPAFAFGQGAVVPTKKSVHIEIVAVTE